MFADQETIHRPITAPPFPSPYEQVDNMEERMDMARNHTRTPDASARVPSASEALEEDIQLAAATTVPVLISGPVSASRAVASEVERRSVTLHGPVEFIDCGAETCHEALTAVVQAGNASDSGNRARCFLLQEVHALPPGDQLLLERHLVDTRHASHPPTRILASSSVPLFPRVADQLFSERLYYLLNVIHIVIPTARRSARRVD